VTSTLPVSAGTPVTTAGWFSPEAEPGKSGIRQRGNRALRHLGYVCRRGLPASLAVLQEETGDFASAALRAASGMHPASRPVTASVQVTGGCCLQMRGLAVRCRAPGIWWSR
jgi:hypothetical protein